MRRIPVILCATSIVAAVYVTGCGGADEPGTLASGGKAGAAGSGGAGGKGGSGGFGGNPVACPSLSFASPIDGAVLTGADDKTGKCDDGFTVDVSVNTDAAAGTTLALLANDQQVGTATVAGGKATFTNVQLDSAGTAKLSVRVEGRECDQSITVDVKCSDFTCAISKPKVSDTHPKLNGEPAPAGDRASSAGAPYQVAVEVTSNVSTGGSVKVTVDDKEEAVTAPVKDGVASFSGVTLIPDGEHKLQATCTNGDGRTSTSAAVTFKVDTTGADLKLTNIKSGDFYPPESDVDPATPELQIPVCGTTTATDALDLSAALGANQKNFCVAVGTASPQCVSAVKGGASGADGACLNVTCPGRAPFDLNVTLLDEAGNVTTNKLEQIKCASGLPSVQIVEPVDGAGTDTSKHILAATSGQARRDLNPDLPGAQYTVVACTDAVGATGVLRTSVNAQPLTDLKTATSVAAQATDGCPAGLGNIFKFENVTVPESQEDAVGALTSPTDLVVEVVDASTAKGTSPVVKVWVDSGEPTLAPAIPADLCGKLYRGESSGAQDLWFTASSTPVQLSITQRGGETNSYQGPANAGIVKVGTHTFGKGISDIVASLTEPSGNKKSLGDTALGQALCSVTVGDPPVINWTAPTATTKFNAATDSDPSTPGWQGKLQVQTDLGASGGTVTFEALCTGCSTNIVVPIQASGVAETEVVTIPDGTSVTLRATTSEIPERGTGVASLSNLTVDTIVPDAPTGLTATIVNRRQTTFHAGWLSPSDGGKPAYSYEVRAATTPISAANFDAAGVSKIPFNGSPAAPGTADGFNIENLVVENDYYFAVAAVDQAGNTSGVVSTGPHKATFNALTLSSGVAGEMFGRSIDGSSSINGDALSDLLVGTFSGKTVYAYFGKSTGDIFNATADLKIVGAESTRFGVSVAVVGDIDGDDLEDIAVGAATDSGPGKVYIYKGRASWADTVTVPDYVIEVDAAAEPKFSTSNFGISLTRLGDFNGDGAPDFAIGAHRYNNNRGLVAVVLGVKKGETFPSKVTLPTAYGTRALAFEGEDIAAGFFGQVIQGLTYAEQPMLVVGAQGASRAYAFKKRAAAGTVTSATAADYKFVDTAGTNSSFALSSLGQFSGNPALGIGAPALASNTGRALLFFGNETDGPFPTARSTVTNSAATATGDGFGTAVFGGGFGGTSVTTSFIADSLPDVAMSSIKVASAAPKLYIVRGGAASKSGDITTFADVTYPLPSTWLGAGPASTGIKDGNGDNIGDLAVAEFKTGTGFDGHVLVLW